MKYLLDTHFWYWGLVNPARLKAAVLAALSNTDSELLMSPVSVWEILALARKGRIEIEGDPVAWVRASLAASPVREIPLTSAIVAESERLPLPHFDPADRFMAATAAVCRATLVTSDLRLIGQDAIPVLSNR